MIVPLTPNPTRKAEALTKAPPTISSRHEEDVALKKWPKPWLCCANGILETKQTFYLTFLLLLHFFFLCFNCSICRSVEIYAGEAHCTQTNIYIPCFVEES
jgi:hypothetical protein